MALTGHAGATKNNKTTKEMKTMKKLTNLLMAAAAIATGSCQSLRTGDTAGGETAQLKLTVSTTAPTRGAVHGNQLPSGSSVALLTEDGRHVYTASGTGSGQTWEPATDADKVMLDDRSRTIRAYYPGDATDQVSGTVIQVTNGHDWMWADPVTADHASSDVTLTMHHALTLFQVNLTQGTYTGTGSVTAVRISSDALAESGTLDCSDGTVAAAQGGAGITDSFTAYTLGAQTGGTRTHEILAVPDVSKSKAVTVLVTVDGTDYAATTEAMTPEQGRMYTLDLTLNNTELKMNKVSVTDWTPEDKGDFELEIFSIVDNYLTIEALEDGLTASLSVNACEYCIDGDGNWRSLAAGTATEAVNTGQTLSFRGNLTPNSSNGIGRFTVSGQFNLKGDCMSMIYGDDAKDTYSLEGKDYAFRSLFSGCTNLKNCDSNVLKATTLETYCYREMFYGCTGLTKASELPATTLASSCYRSMFSGCTGLTQAPELPATTLAEGCYYYMFQSCTGLTQAPELPATTLADNCYKLMFYGCTGLAQAPELSATTLASSCYNSMFQACTGLTQAPVLLPATTLTTDCYYRMFYGCTGLTQAPELPATTLASGCYQSMFSGCTGLTQAPELPVTTLATECYSSMFYGCSGLNQAPELPATTLASNCYESMFYRCTGLTQAPELPATTLATECYYQMFYGCTGLTEASELPATTLADDCYRSMFYGCTGLTQAQELLPATTLAEGCYESMFNGCTGLTKAPKLPATTLEERCYYQMFYGCTSLNYITMLATDISALLCLNEWVRGVAASGTFVMNPYMYSLPTGASGIPSGWTVQYAQL